MMDADELARLRRLAEAATPGPWDFDLYYEDGHACVLGPDDTHLVTWQPMANCGVDAQFTAAARTAVPALLAEVERLTAERDEALQLAYIGEHHHPDLTWKARCEETVADLDALRAWEAEARAAMKRLEEACRLETPRCVAVNDALPALRAVLARKVGP